jgi:hypothetical protein
MNTVAIFASRKSGATLTTVYSRFPSGAPGQFAECDVRVEDTVAVGATGPIPLKEYPQSRVQAGIAFHQRGACKLTGQPPP